MRHFSTRVLEGVGRVTSRALNFVGFVGFSENTYLEHGGGFVVPVLSAIAVLGRTMRNVKSAACITGWNIKTEHVGTMAIFLFALEYRFSVASLGFVLLYPACVYDLPSLFPFWSSTSLRAGRIVLVMRFLRYTSARGEARAHPSFSWDLIGELARDENEKKRSINRVYREPDFKPASFSSTFPPCFLPRIEKPSPRRYDMRVFFLFLTFLSLLLLSPPLSLLI